MSSDDALEFVSVCVCVFGVVWGVGLRAVWGCFRRLISYASAVVYVLCYIKYADDSFWMSLVFVCENSGMLSVSLSVSHSFLFVFFALLILLLHELSYCFLLKKRMSTSFVVIMLSLGALVIFVCAWVFFVCVFVNCMFSLKIAWHYCQKLNDRLKTETVVEVICAFRTLYI